MGSRLEPLPRRAGGLLAALVVSLASAAYAVSLDEAKASGLVGERPDGYVGLVEPGAPAEVKRLVEDVNRKRAHEYETIAEKNGTDASAVGVLAGQKLVERAPAGHFVMDASGKWRKK